MSSRASTPNFDDDDDDFQEIAAAMAQKSPGVPTTSTAKRSHGTMAGDGNESDKEEQSAPAVAPVTLTNQNVVTAPKLYGERKRLRTEQVTELEVFVKAPASLREAQLFANMLALNNKLDKLVTTKSAYEISVDLLKNIHNYSPAVLLSSKITVYKGDGPKNILLAIIKKYRFDVPAGLENIPADWAKIVDAVQESLTQQRSKIKKLIKWSLKINKKDKEYAPPAQRQNIFNLTVALVKGTKCTVNIILCARVALMRCVLLKHSGSNSWNKVDDQLAKIRKQADGDPKKIIKAFTHLLEKDQVTHGVKDYELDNENVDEFQESVDNVIDAGAIDVATSVEAE
ncbi:hypothetical protein FB451DRAFT_1144824 [Mycena latifolia]|nr:hypothetical protein FB451DRAFT_1144824 [Mycena latifolia]